MKIALLVLGFKEIDEASALYLYLNQNKSEHEKLIKNWPENDKRPKPELKDFIEQKIILQSHIGLYALDIPLGEITAFELPSNVPTNDEKVTNEIKQSILESKYSWAWAVKHGMKSNAFVIDLDLNNLDQYEPGQAIQADLLSMVSEEELKVLAENNKNQFIKLNKEQVENLNK